MRSTSRPKTRWHSWTHPMSAASREHSGTSWPAAGTAQTPDMPNTRPPTHSAPESRRAGAGTAVEPVAPTGAFVRDRLAALCAGRAQRVVVGYAVADRCVYAAAGGAPDESSARRWLWPAGCITKLFTAALAADALRRGDLRLEDRILDALEVRGRHPVAAGVTIRHLLEHTHGIDDAGVAHMPLQARGFIGADAMLRLLAGRRFAAPGSIYSYSSAGAWLVAAVLERQGGRPFAELLRRGLFEPLGMRAPACAASSLVPDWPGRICPAVGATLAVSAEDLMTFLLARSCMAGPDDWPAPTQLDAPDSAVMPLPGWNPLERGVYRGWKFHGDGWFGHNSTWPNASLMVRLRPGRGMALVVATRDGPAPLVAAKLFGNLLPEYRRFAIPKPLPPERVRVVASAARRYAGHYRTAAGAVSVEADGHGDLRLIGRGVDSRLMPAAGEVFFLRTPAEGLHFVQFLHEGPQGFSYAWNGRRVFYR